MARKQVTGSSAAPSPVPSGEDEEEVAPRPAALIESLRSFGYTPATAIADLIDNCITAAATNVAVNFKWAGRDSQITILDDGTGMSEDTLRDAMRPGSSNPLDHRSKGDLGRFGLGLKTASFSQARSLTVATKRKNADAVAIRRWDLDYVGSQNRWSLLKSPPNGVEAELARLTPMTSGTLVLWNGLDRIIDDRAAEDERAQAAFFGTVDRVKEHLEMVFHRFLAKEKLHITVNGQPCDAWDPFMLGLGLTELLPCETRQIKVPHAKAQTLRIQPYVLPHRSALSAAQHAAAAGPRGWNLQQGFYLYRADRLIVSGDWFDPAVKPEEHHKLARIAVEITQEMDESWALDVRKSRGRPPAALREDFRRIARATRERAEDVYRHHGRKSVGRGPRTKVAPVWLAESRGPTSQYTVNREHPLIKFLFESAGPGVRDRLNAILSLLERNLPVSHILSVGFSNEALLPIGPDELSPDVVRALGQLFTQLCSAGLAEPEARAYLVSLQPFDRFPEVVDALEYTEAT